MDQPCLIFNMDEGGMPLDPMPLKIVTWKGHKNPSNVSGGLKTQITVVGCVSAGGQCLPPMVIWWCQKVLGILSSAQHNEALPSLSVALMLLCVFLAKQCLAPSTIKVYFSTLRHRQIAAGLPEPAYSTMPKLKLVSNGVARAYAQQAPSKPPTYTPQQREINTIMLWATCTTTFLGFFRMGELAIPNDSAFDPAVHLSPSDVAIDSRVHPTLIRLHLHRSKTDQERKGCDVLLAKTGDDLCPVSAVSAYLALWGRSPGPLSRFQDARIRNPLPKTVSY